MTEKQYYVYRHYIENNTFYVGKGKANRAYDRVCRNDLWKKIVEDNNGQYEIEIVKEFKEEKDARKYEKELTEKYKKIGQCEANIAIGQSLYGANNPMYGKTITEEAKIKISKALSGANNPMYGKKHNKETINKIRNKNIGVNNPMYGKTGEKAPGYGKTGIKHPRSLRITIIIDGIVVEAYSKNEFEDIMKSKFNILGVKNWFFREIPKAYRHRISLFKSINKKNEEKIYFSI